ncbi:MAG: SMP-30/gluconolactonase/LRE family protein [Bryobacteraceae bacterium]|nr:SMP-30/gluconolactonase/LRE family protein [Bryobacteraceae bacterium]MCX7602535.1 SMP-30/gluconolactonase/LRE family protein [Bryobacteraceae bacterium]
MSRLGLAFAAAVLSCFAQEPPEHLLQRMASGFRYADGLALESDGSLLVADPPEDRILRLTPGRPIAVARKPSGGAAGLAFDSRRRLVICETDARRVVRIEDDGRLTVLASEFEGKPLNGPNDLAIRSNDHIYFTDPAFGSAEDRRQLPFHGVFHLPPRGPLEAVWRGDSRPAGIALSPDERTLYVTFADERLVRAFDLARSGSASNGRVLVPRTGGIPLAVRTSKDGDLLVAAGEHLEIYSPRGQLKQRIRIPERAVNLAVHPSTGDIFVSARDSVFFIARRAETPKEP